MPTHAPLAADGSVSTVKSNGIGDVCFGHPKSNSLPATVLRALAEAITKFGRSDDVRVILLRSYGSGAFCAGASFDELVEINDAESGEEFFSGFARVILAMIRAPKFVLVRVHGKTAGGGVGIAAAGDYTFACTGASCKLSELAVGIGPFVVGPVIERRVGTGPYSAMAVDANWRDAAWCEQHALYARVLDDVALMDAAINALAGTLAASNPDAMTELKRVFWEGTELWEDLLTQRARVSGRLVLSRFTREAIAKFRER